MPAENATAIIAAGSALAGVLIAQVATWLHAATDRRDKRRALLLGKLEELADNLHLTTHWVDRVLQGLGGHQSLPPVRSDAAAPAFSASGHGEAQRRVGSRLPAASSAPAAPLPLSEEARRVYVLALLYFPELKTESHQLLQASMAIYFIATGQQSGDDEKLSSAAHDFSAARRAIDTAIPGISARLI